MDMLLRSDDRRTTRAVGASVATATLHALFLLIVGLTLTHQAQSLADDKRAFETPLVFLQQAGPGGGGGGSPAPAPPRPLAIPESSPPAAIPLVAPPPDIVAPPPPPTLVAPIVPNSTFAQATGTAAVMLGSPGGGGTGGGLGPGNGVGIGPGNQRGFGGGTPAPGAGISWPQPIVQPTPIYTSDAMRARIAGPVDVEAIVQPDGTVSHVRIVKSLDRQFGMDDAALKAASQWIFKPALDKDGKPVAVRILIGFDLRVH